MRPDIFSECSITAHHPSINQSINQSISKLPCELHKSCCMLWFGETFVWEIWQDSSWTHWIVDWSTWLNADWSACFYGKLKSVPWTSGHLERLQSVQWFSFLRFSLAQMSSFPNGGFLSAPRADDCRKKSAIWSSASLLKADKCYKNLSSNPKGDGYQAVNQTLSSEMSWKSFHLRNILNRYLRDILNRHLRNILTWGEEAFTLSPLQQHFLSLVSSGLLRSQLTFWLSLLETTGLRTPIISHWAQPFKLNWIFHPYSCSSLKLQLNHCKFNGKELNRFIF